MFYRWVYQAVSQVTEGKRIAVVGSVGSKLFLLVESCEPGTVDGDTNETKADTKQEKHFQFQSAMN